MRRRPRRADRSLMERNIPPGPPSWEPPRPPRTAARSVWTIIGVTLITVLVVGGLLLVAAMVALIVGLNQWAANK